MEMNKKSDQPESTAPESPETGESSPVAKTWQDTVKQFLNNLGAWLLKLKTVYKIILIILVVIILVLILLAYLGVFGQQVADLMKQLVNKIMEMVGSKKS